MWHLWKRLTEKENFKQHLQTVHEGHKAIKCDVCEKDFSQKDDLKPIHEGIKAF